MTPKLLEKKQKKAKQQLKIKAFHKHKWRKDFEDCNFCGGGEVDSCECGTIRRSNTKEIICE